MKNNIPEIPFEARMALHIDVMNCKQLYNRLSLIKNHNPFAPHKIQFYFILIITKGKYTHFINNIPYSLQEGSALFVAKDQIHHFTNQLQHTCGFALVFSHSFVGKYHFIDDNLRIDRLFDHHTEQPIIHQKEVNNESLLDLITTLHREYSFDNNAAKSEILAALLRVFLIKAERAKAHHAITNVNARWLELFNQFKSMLKDDYVNTRNSKAYAANLCVSYKLLNEVVKRLKGNTVKVFIDNFVTTEIKHYLISTSLSVKEISYKTGFKEPANMVKFFKKNTQVTPSKFRQQR